MSKDDFKNFVRNNPILTRHVNEGSMTWQKFYDMYDLYGDRHNVWNEYIKDTTPPPTEDRQEAINSNSDITLKDLVGMVKKVDLESVRKGIDGVQKTISLIQGFGGSDSDSTYTPRPTYKHLDD